MTRDDLIDLLMDLQHDLGKYLLLPLRMLPADASAEQVREALASALLRTQHGPRETLGAGALWRRFKEEAGDSLDGYPRFGELREAVAVALACETLLEPAATLPPRDELEARLGGVASAVRSLIREVQGG